MNNPCEACGLALIDTPMGDGSHSLCADDALKFGVDPGEYHPACCPKCQAEDKADEKPPRPRGFVPATGTEDSFRATSWEWEAENRRRKEAGKRPTDGANHEDWAITADEHYQPVMRVIGTVMTLRECCAFFGVPEPEGVDEIAWRMIEEGLVEMRSAERAYWKQFNLVAPKDAT